MAQCCGSQGNPFVQTLFMGASVVQFSAGIGWNNSDGGANIEVVEDPCVGATRVYANGAAGLLTTTAADKFTPPTVGAPCLFYYGGLQVGGILKSWVQNDSPDGAKAYSIKLSAPNEILDGAPVILSSYDGPNMNVPNLVNVHAYIEAHCGGCTEDGFSVIYPPMGMARGLDYAPAPGWCKQSGEGWSWSQIRPALAALLASGIIHFRGYYYIVDISDLPILNNEIRISGESKTVLAIIDEVCKIAGVEYFLDIIPFGPAGSCGGNLSKSATHFIKVRVGKSAEQAQDQSAADVDAALCTDVDSRLNLGVIGNAISNSTCVRRHNRGLELCMNVVNAFITGEFRKDIWQIDYSGNCDGISDTIWPYWGKDVNGNVIIGTQCNDPYDTYQPDTAHRFPIDISFIDSTRFTDPWIVTTSELRAALAGESSWRTYLMNLEPDKFALLFGAHAEHDIINAFLDGNGDPVNPKKMMDNCVALFNANPDIKKDDPRLKHADLISFTAKAMKSVIQTNSEDHIRASKVYDYIHKYASDFYGKKFMVKLPFICTSYDEDSPWTWGLNWQEADAGWSDGSVLGLNPYGTMSSWILELFRNEDARIKGFCRFFFNNGVPGPISGLNGGLLLDKVGKGDFFIVNVYEAYVSCNADTSIQQGPIVMITPLDWRIVINLSGPVCAAPRMLVPEEWQLIHAIMDAKMQKPEPDNTDFKNFAKFMFNAGNDKSAIAGTNTFLMPVSVAIPLQSKKLVYGPWYAQKGGIFNGGDNGKTEYERKADMSPWSYGSTSLMNLAGMLTASAHVHDKYVIETGDIVFPGAPVGTLGQIIAAGGPIVTRIDVTVGRGDGEVLTSIGMKTWNPDFGEFARRRAASIERAAHIAIKAERMFKKHSLELIQATRNSSYGAQWVLNWKKMIGLQGASSHDFLMGNMFADPENSDWARGSVVTSEPRKDSPMLMPGEDTTDTPSYVDGENWRRRAYMEQIGMFRPFSTVYGPEALKSLEEGGNDDAKYLSRYETLRNKEGIPIPPPAGKDEYNLNETGPSSDGKSSSTPKQHTYFYANEQVPPIFCYEHHKPITVNTLSPFLAQETMISPGSAVDEHGNSLVGWTQDGSVQLSTGGDIGHDIEYVARDGIYPTQMSVRDGEYSPVHWYRAIALRGPLVLAGWGYDIDNYPVPNKNPEDWQKWTPEAGPTREFEEGWLRKPHKWKCGPIDLRWDYRRKCWVAPPAMKIVKLTLTSWMMPGKCAGAILYDDMMQWDNYGKGIQVETECGKTGYRVTVYSNSLRIIPKGWNVTAYYDTTKQRYELLGHDELPLIEAILDEDLYCDNSVDATITGVAGSCTTLDPCSAFSGLKVKLTNPLKQPICRGRKVFVWICDAESTQDEGGHPELGNCDQTCDKPTKFRGVIVQAEFHPECFVVAVDLVETLYWGKMKGTLTKTADFTPKGVVTGSGTMYGTASGSIPATGLCTTAVSVNASGKATGNIPVNLFASGHGSMTGHATFTGTLPAIPFTATGLLNLPISTSGAISATGFTLPTGVSTTIILPTLTGTGTSSGNLTATGSVDISLTGGALSGSGLVTLPHSHTFTGSDTDTIDFTGTFTGDGIGSLTGCHTNATSSTGTFTLPQLTATGYVCVTGAIDITTTGSISCGGGSISTNTASTNISVTFPDAVITPPDCSCTGSGTTGSGTGSVTNCAADTTECAGWWCGGSATGWYTDGQQYAACPDGCACSAPTFACDDGSIGIHTTTWCNDSAPAPSGGGSGSASGCDCDCSCTGGSIDMGTAYITETPHSHTIPCSSICGCLTVNTGGSGSATLCGPVTTTTQSQNLTVDVYIPELTLRCDTLIVEVSGTVIGSGDVNITISGTTSVESPTGNVDMSGVTITGEASAIVTCTGYNTMETTITIVGDTVPVDLSIPSLYVESTGFATLSGSATGNINVSGTIDTSSVQTSGDISVDGDLILPVTGTLTNVCLPVCTVVDIPSVPVQGRIDNVSLQTETNLNGCFTFTGTKCTFTMKIDYDCQWKYYRYDIVVCWRQLFIESEAGKTVCAKGGTPGYCPTDCDPAALCKPFVMWSYPVKVSGPDCSPRVTDCTIEEPQTYPCETYTIEVVCDTATNNCTQGEKPEYNITGTPCNPGAPPGASPCGCS